jgi:hypothetical protein
VFACDVFGTGGLFKDPPYRFQAAFSADRFRIFRTSPGSGERHDSSGAITSSFEGIELCDRRRDMRLLENGREIIRCARANGTIVAQASFEHGRVTVTVEFPVRHINADPERGAFQVETGTVALPAGPDRGRSALDQLEVHYVAFNTLTWMSVLPLPDGPARRLDCAIRLYGCGAS